MSEGIALWEITGDLRQVFDRLEEQGGELTDELEEQLDSLNLAAETKLENLACYIQNLEAEGNAIVETASKAVNRGRSRLAKAKRLRAYMALNMDAIGQDRVDGLAKLKISQNSSRDILSHWIRSRPKRGSKRRTSYQKDL